MADWELDMRIVGDASCLSVVFVRVCVQSVSLLQHAERERERESNIQPARND